MEEHGFTRRGALATGAIAIGGALAPPPVAHAATHAANRPTPGQPGAAEFLWGTAISAHQSEGNDVNSDFWLLENLPETVFREPSGDACDSYHRYELDLEIARAIGLNAYRFGIEWARIEPEPGVFSIAELDRYARVLEACRARGLLPIVSYNHFSVPRWFAMRGGWEVADSADLFARFCGRATEALGQYIGMASPMNEANIHRLYTVMSALLPPGQREKRLAMIAAAARATNAPGFSCLMFADPERIDGHLMEAHAKAYQAIKAGRGDFPVGVTLTAQDLQPVGRASIVAAMEDRLYGSWWDAVNASDFVGVQTYSRLRFDAKGIVPPPPGAELTAAGYEYYPQALGATIRLAARRTAKPIYVTETGIATRDDDRRIAFIDATVAQVRHCMAEGIDVKGYVYWSLLDNYEWTKGYDQQFGLVSVDRTTFGRTPKPSAAHLGRYAAGL
jgi:beta-glucosidase